VNLRALAAGLISILILAGCSTAGSSEAIASASAEAAAASASAAKASESSAAASASAAKASQSAAAVASASAAAASRSAAAASASAAAILRYPSGAPVLKGYPVLVDTKRLDYRVASWIKTAKAVALAPGVYAAYNPAAPDLTAYIDGPNDGDCAVRKLYFPESGGACWSGVLAGPQEPK
jgi:hypothetical protein